MTNPSAPPTSSPWRPVSAWTGWRRWSLSRSRHRPTSSCAAPGCSGAPRSWPARLTSPAQRPGWRRWPALIAITGEPGTRLPGSTWPRRWRSFASWCDGSPSGARPTPPAPSGWGGSWRPWPAAPPPPCRARRPTPQRPELHTGVRAFVAREGALIASALDRAARSLRATPGDREPLYNVIRRMQSLRGLAELGDLVPLPEILDGIELAVGDLTRLFAPPPDVDQVMEGAGRALTRISRDVAERGTAGPGRRGGPPTSPSCCSAPLPSSETSCRSNRSTSAATPSRSPSRSRSPSSPRRSRWARSSWSATASTCVRPPT